MAKEQMKSWQEKVDAVLFKLTQIGVVWLLVGNVLYPKFPLLPVAGTYVSIRMEDFLIALLTGVWVLAMRWKLVELWKLKITRVIVMFLGVGWVATASAIWITQSVDPMLAILHTARRFEYILPFFIVLTTIRTVEDAYFYIKVIVLSMVGVFAYGFGQRYYELPVISTMNKEYSSGIAQAIMFGGRINSTFAGHYDLAAYTVMMMHILFGVLAATKQKRSKIFLWLTILMCFWLLLATASRISYAAYMGSIPLTLWFVRKRLLIVPVLLISGIAMFWAPGLVDRYTETLSYEFLPRLERIEWPWEGGEGPTPTASPAPTQAPIAVAPVNPGESTVKPVSTLTPTPLIERPRVERPPEIVAAPEDRSTAIRFEVEWPRAIRAFMKSPLLGTGYSSITLATDNDYLRALGEVGLLGFGSFMLIFLVAFRMAWPVIFSKEASSEQKIVIGIAGATIGFLANALFIDVFEASKVAILYWMLLGIAVALIRLQRPRDTM